VPYCGFLSGSSAIDRPELMMSFYNMIGVVLVGVLMMLFAIGGRKKHPRRRHWEGDNVFMLRRRNRGSAPAA
jgi:hypothetical protein